MTFKIIRILELHSDPYIKPPPCQIVRNRILRILYRFDPGIGRFIGHFQQVEHFQAGPGAAREPQEMLGFCAPPLFFPELKPKTNIDPVIGCKTVGVAVNDVVVEHPKR